MCVCACCKTKRHHIIPPYCTEKTFSWIPAGWCEPRSQTWQCSSSAWVKLELTGIASLESWVLARSLPVFSEIAEKLWPRWFQRKYFTKSLAERSRQRARESAETGSHPDRWCIFRVGLHCWGSPSINSTQELSPWFFSLLMFLILGLESFHAF